MKIIKACSYFLLGVIFSVALMLIGELFFFNVLHITKVVLLGYHIHHTVYWPLFFLGLIPFIKKDLRKVVFLTGCAFGVILQHGVEWGWFIFITK